MYTDQGHQMSERLWDETLEELKFAGVKDFFRKIRSSTNFIGLTRFFISGCLSHKNACFAL